MNKYLSIFQVTLQEIFAYRLNMVMWRIRQVFVFLIPFFIWKSVFGSGGNINGYTFEAIMTYLFGTTILRSLVMGSRTIDLGWMINSGALTIPLMRPIGIFRMFFARDLADKLFNLSFIIVEIPLIIFIFDPPVFFQKDIKILLITLLLTSLSVLIYFFINIIFGSLAFWSRDVWGPRFLLMVVMEFSTGSMFPLDLLSTSLQKILYMTPFPYLLYVPLKIFLGQDQLFITHLAISIMWVILLGIVANIFWKKGIKSYESEGR